MTSAPSRHLQGLMKELLIWENSLELSGSWGTRIVTLEDILEPASFKDPGFRALVLKHDGPLPEGPVAVRADHPDGSLTWEGRLGTQGERLLLSFPESVTIQGPPKPDRSSRELVSLFARAGALAAPYIKAQREHLQAVGVSSAQEWPRELLHRWWERDEHGEAKASFAIQRVGEGLFYWGELTGSGGRDPGGVKEFIRRWLPGEFRSIVENQGEGTLWGGLWPTTNPFWRELEVHLAGPGKADLVADLPVSYTRNSRWLDLATERIVLHTASPETVGPLLNSLPEGPRRWAEALDFTPNRLGSPTLASQIRAADSQFKREHLEVRLNGEAIGLAILSQFPPIWSVLKSCDAAWIFPLRPWSEEERRSILGAVQIHKLGEHCPGFIEVGTFDQMNSTKAIRALLWGGGIPILRALGSA